MEQVIARVRRQAQLWEQDDIGFLPGLPLINSTVRAALKAGSATRDSGMPTAARIKP